MKKWINAVILFWAAALSPGNTSALAVTGAQLPKACVVDNHLIRNAVQLSRVERLNSSEFRVFWDLESAMGAPIQSLQPELGGQFYVVRCMPTGRWDVVGQGTLEGINGTLAEAKVTGHAVLSEKDAAQQAIQTGNLYPRPMTGDLIAPIQTTIERRANVSRKFEFPVEQLFEVGGQSLQTYNLSDEGRKKIRDAIAALGDQKGRLLIEGFIHRAGPRDDLQIESQIRATSVAQFIRREFGISDDQIVAIGLGASSYETGFMPVPKWPAVAVEDGIVIRVLPE